MVFADMRLFRCVGSAFCTPVAGQITVFILFNSQSSFGMLEVGQQFKWANKQITFVTINIPTKLFKTPETMDSTCKLMQIYLI